MLASARLRSLLVGLASAALDAGLFALCTLFWAGGAALLAARWICAAAGAVVNFSGNRVWAFGRRRARLGMQLGRYALAAAAGISLTSGLWWILFRSTGLDPRLLHLVSLGLVWSCFSFPVLRFWVFASDRG